jgi:hypothetical protein
MPTISFEETKIESCFTIGKGVYLNGNPHHAAVAPMRANGEPLFQLPAYEASGTSFSPKN